MDDAILDHLMSQRACREYSGEQVPDAALAIMLRAATHAPSAENAQPWVFVVVRDPVARAAIDELSRQVWDGGGRDHAVSTLSPRFLEQIDRFWHDGHGGAPVLVVVAGDGRGGSPAGLLASSVFPATQNLLLAAAALGYGSSMTTLGAHAPEALAAIVGLPDGVRPFAIVPVGRPARSLGPPRRKPVAEVAHLDRFGAPFG